MSARGTAWPRALTTKICCAGSTAGSATGGTAAAAAADEDGVRRAAMDGAGRDRGGGKRDAAGVRRSGGATRGSCGSGTARCARNCYARGRTNGRQTHGNVCPCAAQTGNACGTARSDGRDAASRARTRAGGGGQRRGTGTGHRSRTRAWRNAYGQGEEGEVRGQEALGARICALRPRAIRLGTLN